MVESGGKLKAERIPQLISGCQWLGAGNLDGAALDLDIRIPIAILFLILGALLCGYGLLAPAPAGIVQSGINVNLAWGTVMALFGAILLAAALASRHQK